MKKLAIIALTALLAFTGCSTSSQTEEPSTTPSVNTTTENTTEKPENTNNENAENAENSETTSETNENSNNSNSNKEPIDIGFLKGPTAIGGVLLMNEIENGKVFGNYNIEIYTTPDEVTAKIISGELDVAAVPANMASVLYNKTEGEILTAAINTLGTLYIVEKGETIETVNDLEEKTIIMAGQGSVPEFVLQYILDKSGVSDVNVEYYQSHGEVMAALVGNEETIAILPEPFASASIGKDSEIRVAIDMAKEWDVYSYQEKDVPNTLPMGTLVVRKDFVEEHEKDFNKFLDEYEFFLTEVAENPAQAAPYVIEYGIVDSDEAVAESAIIKSNIQFIDGSQMLRIMDNFIVTMFDLNPAAVGNKKPEESMYYVRSY